MTSDRIPPLETAGAVAETASSASSFGAYGKIHVQGWRGLSTVVGKGTCQCVLYHLDGL
jgi:hypothetical protein